MHCKIILAGCGAIMANLDGFLEMEVLDMKL